MFWLLPHEPLTDTWTATGRLSAMHGDLSQAACPAPEEIALYHTIPRDLPEYCMCRGRCESEHSAQPDRSRFSKDPSDATSHIAAPDTNNVKVVQQGA